MYQYLLRKTPQMKILNLFIVMADESVIEQILQEWLYLYNYKLQNFVVSKICITALF